MTTLYSECKIGIWTGKPINFCLFLFGILLGSCCGLHQLVVAYPSFHRASAGFCPSSSFHRTWPTNHPIAPVTSTRARSRRAARHDIRMLFDVHWALLGLLLRKKVRSNLAPVEATLKWRRNQEDGPLQIPSQYSCRVTCSNRPPLNPCKGVSGLLSEMYHSESKLGSVDFEDQRKMG